MNLSKLSLVLTRTAIGISVIAPLWFWKGGMMELESLQFVKQYLDGRPLLPKIFDPYLNDFKTYQARELSYFIDYLDAHVFKRLMAMDLTIFVPASAILATLLTIALFFVAVRKYRVISPLTGSLLLLMYLTNYVHLVTMGMFYRSGKPLLAALLVGGTMYVAWLLTRQQSPDSTPRERRWQQAALFGLFLLMGLLDRQGFFYAAVGFALIAANALRVRARWDLAIAAGGAIVCVHAYNVWLGPAIVHALNGYTPTRAYQDVPRDDLGGFAIYRHAGEVLLEEIRVLTGSLPGLAGILPFAAVAIAGIWRSPRRLVVGVTMVVLALSQIVLFAFMIARLPAIYEWIDHRYYYYPLPFLALLLGLTVVFLDRMIAGWPRWRIVMTNTLIALAIVGNVAHWTVYRDVQRASRWFPRIYAQNELLKSSFKSGQMDARLIMQYREFYELCLKLSPGLQAKATPAPPAPVPR